MKKILRLGLSTIGAWAAALSLFLAGGLHAQSFPSRPVRIVVPQSAGGLVDILARGYATELSRLWDQPVIVENRAGANTIIGTEAAAKSAPDGYTLLLANSAAISINPFLYKKLPYDPERDFALLYNIASSAFIIVVTPSLPVNSLREFIELAKLKPGEITYGSFGMGSASHIETESLSARTGIRMTHIPYKGIAEVLPALARGDVQMALSGIPPAIPLVKGGRIRVLALTASGRDPALPDVPTAAESGYPGLNLAGWFGFVAPAATPRAILDKISADLAQISNRRDFKERTITRVGLEPLLQPPERFAEFVREERARYSQMIKDLNLNLD